MKELHSFVCAKCGRTVCTLKLAPYCLRAGCKNLRESDNA